MVQSVSECWRDMIQIAPQEMILKASAASLEQDGAWGPQPSLWQWEQRGKWKA